jgi:uncharacterized membrane protein
MSFLQVLPLAVVMVAGPQMLSAIFLATSEDWRRNSAAFVAGAALSISTVVTLAYLLGGEATDQGTSSGLLDVLILALLLVAMVNVYLNRADSEPPKWMGRLTTATPRFSFRLGFLLLGVFPTDIVTSVTVGSYLAAQGLPLTDGLGFLALTLLLLALPSLAVLLLGERAEAFLPKAREWMQANAWIVNEVVLLFFVAIVASGL